MFASLVYMPTFLNEENGSFVQSWMCDRSPGLSKHRWPHASLVTTAIGWLCQRAMCRVNRCNHNKVVLVAGEVPGHFQSSAEVPLSTILNPSTLT